MGDLNSKCGGGYRALAVMEQQPSDCDFFANEGGFDLSADQKINA